ncbi:MAG: 4Fe-4S dicluster domain-containing protein [Desulfohalobiaceae bacterium]
MGRVEIRRERCKGCLLCTLVCPEEILVQSQELNSQGYKVVQVVAGKEQECKGCAFCAEICPDCVLTVYRKPKGKKVQNDVA